MQGNWLCVLTSRCRLVIFSRSILWFCDSKTLNCVSIGWFIIIICEDLIQSLLDMYSYHFQSVLWNIGPIKIISNQTQYKYISSKTQLLFYYHHNFLLKNISIIDKSPINVSISVYWLTNDNWFNERCRIVSRSGKRVICIYFG